jgi:membrane-bound lytic murein transglycosylase A
MLRRSLIRFLILGSIALVSPVILAQSTLPPSPTPTPSPTLTPTPQPPPKPIALKPATQLAPKVGLDDQVLRDRQALIRAVDFSLQYLQTPKAKEVYQKYPVREITLDRVQRSLNRFRALLTTTRTTTALQKAIQKEFTFYQSVGRNNKGTVAFTGYFEPVHSASRKQTAQYRYPLYALPADFKEWKKPHPTRLELEGEDGLQGSKGRLQGLELVWLRDRLEAFLIQVQGSARLQLTDGTTMTVGVAGLTDQPYSGIGRELVKAGKLKLENLNLTTLTNYFKRNPADLNVYLPRNQRFVFFRDTQGAPAMGNLSVPVTAGRSIATDKSLMPPGALALIQTQLPIRNAKGKIVQRSVNRYVLDQDTGGAIIGPGRVDVFIGTGPQAGEKAGLVKSTGQLYYLLLRE